MILVDCSWMIYRSAFKFQNFRTSNGMFTGDLFAVRDLMTLVSRFHDLNIGLLWDSYPKEKHDTHPQYKAGRVAKIKPQWKECQELFQSFGFTSFTAKGYEADELAYSLTMATPDTENVILFTNDDDWFSMLVRPKTFILRSAAGNLENQVHLLEKYGLTPKLVIPFKALFGDSDIPRAIDRINKKKMSTYLMHLAGIHSNVDPESIEFLNTVFSSGMSEFFGKNEIVRIMKGKEKAALNASVINFRPIPPDQLEVIKEPYSVEKINGLMDAYEMVKVKEMFESAKPIFENMFTGGSNG